MSNLQPLLARSRYTREEWALASAGECSWLVADYPGTEWCWGPSDPNSFYRYCAGHDHEARRDLGDEYGQ